MNRDELKKLIKCKFGSFKKFSELSGLDYSWLRNFLNYRDSMSEDEQVKTVEDIKEMAEKLSVKETESELTNDQCKVIKAAILEIHGSVNSLAEKSPEWSQPALTQLTRGSNSTDRKSSSSAKPRRKSKKVIALVEDLIEQFDSQEENSGLSEWAFNLNIQLKNIISK